MTLLIVFLAITNMAVGYGLAVYLGNSNQPIQITRGRLRRPKAEAVASLETATEEPEVPMTNAEPSVPAEASETTATTGSDSPEVNESIKKPALAHSVEAAAPKAEKEEKPVPQQVQQLDVSDLKPEAQPSSEATEPEQLSDKPGEQQAVEETPEELDQQPRAEVAAETVEDTEEVVTNVDSEESIPREEPEAAAAKTAAEEPEPEEPEPEEPEEPEEVDELESLAQMLQTAVAESSVKEEDDVEVAESVAVESMEVGEATEDVVDKLPEAEATDDAELAPEVLAGIESFRSQLAEMNDSPPPKPENETDDLVEAPATT